MSFRGPDTRFILMLRTLQDRVRKLENQRNTNAVNSIRLGNLVLEADPRSGTPTSLKITNKSTGIVTLIATP